MVSIKKLSKAGTTIIITEKGVSQWQDIMRKFTEKHKEQCKTEPLDVIRSMQGYKEYPTGSRYEGTLDVLGMCGFGDYSFPNGVQYEGEFLDGMFHGKGELRYENDYENYAVIRGKWEKGVMTERTLTFSDTLEYNENTWKYCRMPDRRFGVEYNIDLMPAGKSFLTADQPTKVIPPGFYDTGDGFYNPETKVIYRYKIPSSIKRSPSVSEQKWILDNCRKHSIEPIGPRPDLYEKWLDPKVSPGPHPPPAAGIKAQSSGLFRKSSQFEHDFSAEKLDFYNSTHFETSESYVKDTHVSQWQRLMKEFCKKHEETCNTAPLDLEPGSRRTKDFPTGSTYEGDWDTVMGINGHGYYSFPNGIAYDGKFRDGMMHGKGEMRYPIRDGCAVIRGMWRNGVMIDRTIIFSDTLQYTGDSWQYCRMPDRRFAIEYNIDLMPAGKSYLTAEQPTKKIPPGYYDTGDGFYDPKTKVIYKYKNLTKIKRAPSVQEQQWILDNCRLNPEVPLGPRPDLYEKFSEPVLHPAPQPPPAGGIRAKASTMFKTESLHEQAIDYDHMPVFYDASKSVQSIESPQRKFGTVMLE